MDTVARFRKVRYNGRILSARVAGALVGIATRLRLDDKGSRGSILGKGERFACFLFIVAS
jgi:hypothetical protein